MVMKPNTGSLIIFFLFVFKLFVRDACNNELTVAVDRFLLQTRTSCKEDKFKKLFHTHDISPPQTTFANFLLKIIYFHFAYSMYFYNFALTIKLNRVGGLKSPILLHLA